MKRRRVNEFGSFPFVGIPPFVLSFVRELVTVVNYGFRFCDGLLRFWVAPFMVF
jgi:hypothetical protein